jgi:hypothetical protein
MAAGNYDTDVMYTVALSSVVHIPNTDAVSKPVLHVQPISDLLVAGKSNISQACMGYDLGQGRKLLQLDSSSINSNTSSSSSSSTDSEAQSHLSDTTATNSSSSGTEQQQPQQPQEPALTMLYPARFRVQYQLNDSAPVFLGEYAEVNPPPKIVLDLEDKEDVSGHSCYSYSRSAGQSL